eukprot:15433378-Alexandrium_andersonii.AAC.1
MIDPRWNREPALRRERYYHSGTLAECRRWSRGVHFEAPCPQGSELRATGTRAHRSMQTPALLHERAVRKVLVGRR